MREIKFRVWNKSINKMSLVAQIRYADDGFSGTIIIIPAPIGEYPIHLVNGENGVLQQYTGLKDKNGKDIYVGDILAKSNNSQHQYRVIWYDLFSKFTAQTFILDIDQYDAEYWRLQYKDHSIQGALTYDNCIIGNIYENPELLK